MRNRPYHSRSHTCMAEYPFLVLHLFRSSHEASRKPLSFARNLQIIPRQNPRYTRTARRTRGSMHGKQRVSYTPRVRFLNLNRTPGRRSIRTKPRLIASMAGYIRRCRFYSHNDPARSVRHPPRNPHSAQSGAFVRPSAISRLLTFDDEVETALGFLCTTSSPRSHITPFVPQAFSWSHHAFTHLRIYASPISFMASPNF